MEAMKLLRTRYSALKLDGPSTSVEAVDAMLEAASRAPDHGRLRPWRLILIEGAARLSFGEILAASLARRTLLPATRPWPENARRRFARRSSSWSRRDAIGRRRYRSSSRLFPPAARLTAL